jgi:large subunit ribosomal protein L24e
MVKDTVFEFEKKRNEPLVYNRDLYVTTIAAIQRIGEVKRKREELFWENRFVYFIQG